MDNKTIIAIIVGGLLIGAFVYCSIGRENFMALSSPPFCYAKSERAYAPCLRGYRQQYNERLHRDDCCVNNSNY